MSRKLSTVLGSGAAIILITAWFLYPRQQAPDRAQFRFMHCPHCERELAYNADFVYKPCPQCGREYLMVPTAHSIGETGAASPYATLVPAVLLELNVLLVTAWWVCRPRVATAEEEDYLYTRCRSCKQKIRYLASRVGCQGRCPRCKQDLTFPDCSDLEED